MSHDRSLVAFQLAREAQQKFDYFITGLTSALFAYLAQDYQPSQLGLSVKTFEAAALICFVVSFFSGLKRIEISNVFLVTNQSALHASACAGQLTTALNKGPSDMYNSESGELVSFEELTKRRERYMEEAEMARNSLNINTRKGCHYYLLRNYSLFLGFISLLLSKLLQPYFL